MNMETIKQMVESDLKIDGTELGDESIRIPMLHGKFLNIFHDESQRREGLSPDRAMDSLCLVLFNLNEFLYID
jgi:hypothetical protein